MRGLGKSAWILILAVLIPWSSAPADDAPSVPRYSLPVGRRLTYSVTSISKGDKINESSIATIQVTVVKENPDGSHRLIFRVTVKNNQAIQGNVPDTVMLGSADVSPDGRLASPVTPDQRIEPSQVFPRLPRDAAEADAGWIGEDEAELRARTFTAHPLDRKQWDFRSVESGVLGKIYGITEDSSFHFDMDKGIINKVEVKTGQTFGFQMTGADTLELQSDTTVAPEEIAQLATDVAAFLATSKAYDEQTDRAMHATADEADRIMASAKNALTLASQSAKDTDVQAQYQQVLSKQDETVKYVKGEAEREQMYLNKPAPEFATVDTDGNDAKLADFKGKVVVLDFWYRGCGWCMYAMPQIKQIAADFKGKPVAVLGMNTDADQKDAKFVIDAQQLNYPTLKAAGLPEKFGVQGYPTLIIIDPAGVVRQIHMGYSPTLRQDIGQGIQELLKP